MLISATNRFASGRLPARSTRSTTSRINSSHNMKKLKMLVLALLIMAAVINNTQAAEATVSPNGFKSPECTYGADMLTYSYGWTLKFSRSYGRDAYLWPSLITNGTTTINPQANDLMVLDAWSG